MDDIREALGVAIEKSGLKRRVVAARSGLSPQQLCDITRKRRRLGIDELINICEALGISPDEVMTPSQPDKPSA